MKKTILTFGIAALAFSSAAICVGAKPANMAMAESSEISVVSEEPAKQAKYEFSIKDATIRYRNDEESSYVEGTASIGSYFLSADGWNVEDVEPIVMTIKGNVTTKLESKIVYIYEYKPTHVLFNGKEVFQNEDKTFTLERPASKGEFDLQIDFTRQLVTNPVDLVGLNWASFLTVQNLMTILSWVAITAAVIILYFINRKYKKRGSTTLEEVKKFLSAEIENVYGKEFAEKVGQVFDTTVAASFQAISQKLDNVDNNSALLIRAMLLMQENTPEARLAVTECLAKLHIAEDEESAKVKALIESEIAKYKDEQDKRMKAIEEAQRANDAWREKAEETEAKEPEEEPAKEEEFGSL